MIISAFAGDNTILIKVTDFSELDTQYQDIKKRLECHLFKRKTEFIWVRNDFGDFDDWQDWLNRVTKLCHKYNGKVEDMRKKTYLSKQIYFKETGKFQSLINSLTNCRKASNYRLTIISCYFSIEAGNELINEILNKFTDYEAFEIDIYIDIKEVLKHSSEAYISWTQRLAQQRGKLSINIYAVYIQENQTLLFHSKAYSLVSCNQPDFQKWIDANLTVSSANLTKRGLTNKKGNIELLFHTKELHLIQSFYKQLEELKKEVKFIPIRNEADIDNLKNLSTSVGSTGYWADIEDWEDDEPYYFKYKLLNLGYLVYQWEDYNLAEYFSTTLGLKKSALSSESKINPAILKAVNETGYIYKESKASITANYKECFKDIKSYINKDKDFVEIRTRYGVETVLGYWIPKQIVDNKLKKNEEEFENFKEKIISEMKVAIKEIKIKINEDWEKWKELAEAGGKGKLDKIPSGLKELAKNEELIKRIYYRYSIVKMPYHILQKQEVENMYTSLIVGCHQSPEKPTQDAVLKAEEKQTLSPIEELSLENG